MDVPRFHVGDVEDVRDDHITRIAEDEVRCKFWRAHASNSFRAGKKMRGCNITRTKRIKPGKRFFRFTLLSAFAFVFGVKRMDSFGIRRDVRKAKQNLVEQMRAAFREGNAKQN